MVTGWHKKKTKALENNKSSEMHERENKMVIALKFSMRACVSISYFFCFIRTLRDIHMVTNECEWLLLPLIYPSTAYTFHEKLRANILVQYSAPLLSCYTM